MSPVGFGPRHLAALLTAALFILTLAVPATEDGAGLTGEATREATEKTFTGGGVGHTDGPGAAASGGSFHSPSERRGAGASAKGLGLDFLNGWYDPLHDDVPLEDRWLEHSYNGYGVLQFTAPIFQEWKDRAEELGVTFFDYVPDYAFQVRFGGSDTIEALAKLPFVRYVGPFHPGFKISPYVGGPSRDFGCDDGWMDIRVSVFDDMDALLSRLSTRAHDVWAFSQTKMTISIAASEIPGIAALGNVRWIEDLPELEWHNDEAAYILRVRPVWNQLGLDGTGQIVGVADTGLDTGNVHTMTTDLRGRVISIYDHTGGSATPTDTHGHGTHTTGSVLGSGNHSVDAGGTPYQYRGMAYNASVVFQALQGGFTALGDLNDLYQEAYDDGARIHSNSWGLSPNNAYTGDAEETDQFMWNHKDMLIVFSAGNSGPGAGSVRSPGLAKNTLTVGASQNYRPAYTHPQLGKIALDPEDLVVFSSWGPTAGGRMKPDVTAPGSGVRSIRSSASSGSGYYVDFSGTSMSCPLTAGTTALIRQWYEDEQGHTPSGALMKATVINGAHDMYNLTLPIPNMQEGWGRVNLSRSIKPPAPAVIDFYDNTTGLTTQTNHTYEFMVGNNSVPVRLTLVWHDYDGNPSVTTQTVNNLNLNVTGPDGKLYKGNIFSKGSSDSGGFNDNVNNVEGVRFKQPQIGKYKVEVKAVNVPQGPQPYALVISYGENDGTGVVDFDLPSYKLPLKPRIAMIDADLMGSGTHDVYVSGPSDAQGEDITLTEKPSGSGYFTGKVTLTEGNPTAGQLKVQNEDVIQVEYADSSLGGSMYDTAYVDSGGPSNLTVEAVPWGNALNLTWKARTLEPDITGYSVYRSMNQDSGYVKVKQVPYVTKTMDVDLTDGVQYFYKLRCINASAQESGFSLWASGTPEDIVVPKLHFSQPASQSKISSHAFINWTSDNDTREVELDHYLDLDANGVDDDGGVWTAIDTDDTPFDGFTWDTSGLPNGSTVMVRARAADEVPHVGPYDLIINLTLDNLAPPAPVLDEMDEYHTSPITNVTGVSELDSTVWLYKGGSVNATAPAGVDGSFRVQMELVEGLNSYTARALDTVGNGPGDESNTVSTILDTVKPAADAGEDREVDQGFPTVCNGSNSTDANGVVDYLWEFYDGQQYSVQGQELVHEFQVLGNHPVTLTVWDPAGRKGSDEVNLTVVDRTPPTARAGEDQVVDEDALVMLDGSASHDNNPAFELVGKFDWAYTDPEDGEVHLTKQAPSVTFGTPGYYPITLTVTDPAGLSGTDVVNITVQDITPPDVDAGADISALTGERVSLDGSNTTDNDPAFPAGSNFAWTFLEDGRTVEYRGRTDEHSFETAGVYTVTLSVTDAAGNRAKDTLVVNVTDPVVDDGDDDDDDDDGPVEPELPTFTVRSIDPPEGASGVSVGTEVSVRFSSPIVITSIGQGTIRLHEGGENGTRVAGTVNPDATINGARFVPAAPLKYSMAYTVVVAPKGLASTAGEVLDGKHATTFTTEGEGAPGAGGGSVSGESAPVLGGSLLWILVVVIAAAVVAAAVLAIALKRRREGAGSRPYPAESPGLGAVRPMAGDGFAAPMDADFGPASLEGGPGLEFGLPGGAPEPLPGGLEPLPALPAAPAGAVGGVKDGGGPGTVGMSIDELESLQAEVADEEAALAAGEEEAPDILDEMVEEQRAAEVEKKPLPAPLDGSTYYGPDTGAGPMVMSAADAAEMGAEKEFHHADEDRVVEDEIGGEVVERDEAGADPRGEPDLECPECGAGVYTGDAYCESCGVEFDLSDQQEDPVADGNGGAGLDAGIDTGLDLELDLDDDELLDD